MIRSFLLARASLVLFLATFAAAAVGTDSPTPTPPMGWNSWDSYGTTVREEQVKANADWMAEHRDLG
jgi:alpha-galactosidase